MEGVVGADQESGPDPRELARGGEHQLTDPLPVVAVEASHVLGERRRMHRDLGMGVRAEKPSAFHADGPIAKSGTFGGARNDTDVVGHGWRTSSKL
jgi:hypothetical protein